MVKANESSQQLLLNTTKVAAIGRD
jgi:hypothetical protein